MPTLKFDQITEPERDILFMFGSKTNEDIVIPKGSTFDQGSNTRSVYARTPAKTNSVSFYLNLALFIQAQDFCKTNRELLIECSTRAKAYRGAIEEMLARPERITLTVDHDKD